MALHKIDGQRAAPDILVQRLASGTTSVTNRTTGTSSATTGSYGVGRVITRDKQLVVNDGSDDRVVIGFQPIDNTYGIRVSKAGYDATTSPNSDMVMSSEFDMMKIVQIGTGTFSGATITSGQTNISTIYHGLGFIPTYQAFVGSGGSTYSAMPYAFGVLTSGPTTIGSTTAYMYTDSTNIYLAIFNGTTSSINYSGFPFKYYLFQETAN
jgi:hypothetical protein